MGYPSTSCHMEFREEFFPFLLKLISGKYDKEREEITSPNFRLDVYFNGKGFVEVSEAEAAFGSSQIMDMLHDYMIPFDANCPSDWDIRETNWFGRVDERGVFKVREIATENTLIGLDDAVRLSQTEEGREELVKRFLERTFQGPALADVPLTDDDFKRIAGAKPCDSLDSATL